jgi:hypothetical protein
MTRKNNNRKILRKILIVVKGDLEFRSQTGQGFFLKSRCLTYSDGGVTGNLNGSSSARKP